jgi:hypothetical protein
MDKLNLLKKEIINDLVKLVPEMVCKIQVPEDEVVCYLALVSDDYNPLVALLQLGFESVRKDSLEKYGLHGAWNSGNQMQKYSLKIKENHFLSKERNLIELCGGENHYDVWWAQSQQVMFEVAKRLNEYDWKCSFKLAEDFVVYSDWEAIDVENGDLSLSVPLAKINILKNNGYL